MMESQKKQVCMACWVNLCVTSRYWLDTAAEHTEQLNCRPCSAPSCSARAYRKYLLFNTIVKNIITSYYLFCLKIFLAPLAAAAAEVVLEEEVRATVSVDNVADGAVVLLATSR